MRDIKFRSWDAEQKEFNTFDLLGQYDDHAYYLLDTDNVEQFTGLQDRSGVDVYDGDIVKWESIDLIMLVSWSVVDCAFTLSNVNSNGGAMMNQEYMLNYEVIGNIHQNPELVEK